MSELPSLTVAGDLSRIHQVITRALQVAIQQCQFFETKTLTTDGGGLQCYITALLQLLDSHHQIEDDLIFPYFQQKIPTLPVAEMERQHQALVPLLERLAGLLPTFDQSPTATIPWTTIAETLIEIEALWEPHYQLEEAHLNEGNISQVIDSAEQERLCHLYAEASKHHITADYLVLPFILYNLPLPERQVMAQAFPPQVTEKLIPGEWYSQWQVMSPYLLT
ncbi:hemerythrin domain-containing protein [Synechocystis sp. LKSZ1]|uniref:hemerythrin domain-containing protein n=1 Tax=Synechocystis sp. LKSZ1 TaxID=3144951 RepID=UPI00336BCC5A